MAATSHGTLAANTVKTVTVEPGWNGIEVVNRDMTGVIWVRLDGQNPTIEGADSYAVFGARSFPLRRGASGSVTVRMISDAARKYTVEAA
jgi:hypothetical protein